MEDKILQRTVVEVLKAVYETDFLGFSYGFRPGGSPHHALDVLAARIVDKKVNWVLDADLSDYFSSLDHQWLLKFLEHRIADRRVLRLVGCGGHRERVLDGVRGRRSARSFGFPVARERLRALHP